MAFKIVGMAISTSSDFDNESDWTLILVSHGRLQKNIESNAAL